MTFVDGEYFPLFVGVLLVAMALIGYRLSCAAQPMRLLLGKKAEELIANPALPPLMKSHIRDLAASVFSMRSQLFAAVFLIPLVAIIFVARNRLIRSSLKELRTNDPILQREFEEVCRLHRALTLANHPLLFPVVELEMVVFMTPAILLRAIIKGMLPDSDDREILSVIEDRRVGLFNVQRVVASSR